LSIAFLKLFRCQFRLHLSSFCHSSSIHYLDGFHIIAIKAGISQLRRPSLKVYVPIQNLEVDSRSTSGIGRRSQHCCKKKHR
jgi:hypothetical protein